MTITNQEPMQQQQNESEQEQNVIPQRPERQMQPRCRALGGQGRGAGKRLGRCQAGQGRGRRGKD